MDAKVLPTVAVSVAEMEGRVCSDVAVCAAVAMGAPAIVAVEDEDEGSPWEAKGIDGTTSSGSGAVWISGRAERERLPSVVAGEPELARKGV